MAAVPPLARTGFDAQVRWSRRWGGRLIGLAAVGLCLLALARPWDPPLPGWAALVSWPTFVLLCAGVVLGLFGGVARPFYRRAYFWARGQSLYVGLAGGWPLRFAPVRLWLWVTPQGEDRDVQG